MIKEVITYIPKKIIKWAVLYPISMYRLRPISHSANNAISTFVLRCIWGKITDEITVYTDYGTKFVFHHPEDTGWEYVYTHRTFEAGTTKLLNSILRPDDVVFDVGGNFGWYTVLFSQILKNGRCHTFEPIPWILDKLKFHLKLNGLGRNVTINQVAVGEKSQTVRLYSFEGENHGLSSLLPLGREKYSTCDATMITLDQYVRDNKINKVDFIKCDVEGSEFDVAKGAAALFSLPVPPMWLFEINYETAEAFHHKPSEILDF
ncbi:MAG: FkbM family methyltransferase, partial [Deltaproteobacteria bacterium]|nr:FkbM family methyltransferase [Deltaproteobacteria bacterium]